MKTVVTGRQMKKLDAYAIEKMGMPSLVLMERAALCVVDEMKKQGCCLDRVLVVCGSGNNGADGVAVARILHLQGIQADIFLVGEESSYSRDLKTQITIADNYGTSFVNNPAWSEYTTIVDAIFGVGLSREITGHCQEVIAAINYAKAFVVALDIPSGVHSDTGAILHAAVMADMTVTFAFAKIGLLLYPGAGYAGQVHIQDIGIPMAPVEEETVWVKVLEREGLLWIPRRVAWGNKSTFGKVFLMAGTNHMSGAAYLCAKACLRTGAGMVKIHTRKENREILQSQFPEAILSTYSKFDCGLEKLLAGYEWADVIAIGPGIGKYQAAEEMLVYTLEHCDKPLLIDADGLNLLTRHMELLRTYKSRCILTPHVGEMSRLTGLSIKEIKKNPLGITHAFAKEYQVICVCKDVRTVISDGQEQLFLNISGNEGMATAGSGDVLFGIITGLMAQGLEPMKAALCGTYLHGLAGDAAKEKKSSYSLIAHDIIDEIPQILRTRENSQEK